jgi:hypothetical protein
MVTRNSRHVEDSQQAQLTPMIYASRGSAGTAQIFRLEIPTSNEYVASRKDGQGYIILVDQIQHGRNKVAALHVRKIPSYNTIFDAAHSFG